MPIGNGPWPSGLSERTTRSDDREDRASPLFAKRCADRVIAARMTAPTATTCTSSTGVHLPRPAQSRLYPKVSRVHHGVFGPPAAGRWRLESLTQGEARSSSAIKDALELKNISRVGTRRRCAPRPGLSQWDDGNNVVGPRARRGTSGTQRERIHTRSCARQGSRSSPRWVARSARDAVAGCQLQ
jgi:hypothetical protein